MRFTLFQEGIKKERPRSIKKEEEGHLRKMSHLSCVRRGEEKKVRFVVMDKADEGKSKGIRRSYFKHG